MNSAGRASGLRLGALLVALFLLAVAGRARAHAYPEHSDPKVGSTVSGSPSQVRIWFDSELEPAFSSMEVKTASGAREDKKDARVDASDHKLLEVSIPRLGPGTYRVTWSVLTRDGHRTSGHYQFTVK